MFSKKYLVPILLLMILAITVTARGTQTSSAQTESPPIRLRAGTFNPGLGLTPDLPAELTKSEYVQGQTGYYIVQFVGPVQQSWKQALTDAGADLLGYIPDYAIKVRMNTVQAAAMEEMGFVNWVGIYQPAYKISPDIDLTKSNLLQIRIEQGASGGLTRGAIVHSGAEILSRDGNILIVAASPEQTVAIANILSVSWIDTYVLPEKHNEFGAGVIVGANAANANGFNGSTQIAAVADTGLGNGTASGAHPDIPASRVTSIYNWPGAATGCFQSIVDDGARDVDSGHGTHTAVSVVGDGGSSGEGKGAAPAANLVFQATESFANITFICQILGGYPGSGYFLTGLPDDLTDLYQQAYNDGARIHSNSWGSSQAGVYTLNSAQTDNFIWTNPDMSITFSAGNAGIDANSNGVVDDDSIGSPATAKNVITVGASENERTDNFPCDNNLTYLNPNTNTSCNSDGGINDIFTYNEAWGSDFPANPIASDPSAGNAEQMAAFSSRGPTDDGRIKPDVVAPGTWVLSGYSGLHKEGYGDPVNPQNNAYQYDGWGFPLNNAYKYMGGTSMSNPIVAGAATVVRDYYQKADTHAASAALVKATLINSAVDIMDENNDGADDNDYPIPNSHEGWGRVNLENATDYSHQFVDNATGLNTSGGANYQYNVAAAGQPFKVTLVWSDFPSTETAAQNLVNDLDLVVTSPGGTQYQGNVFTGGWSQAGGSPDRINNVENVYVQAAAAGTWTVQINGFNVPNGPQPFALVVDGTFGTPPPTPTNTAQPTATNTPLPTATDTPPPTATSTIEGPTATNTPTATATSEPPTATSTPPPTETSEPPTPTNTPTATSVPPTATNTPLPTPTNTPSASSATIYVSSSSNGSANGLSFADEDIIAFDTATNSWALYFDGSDVGLTAGSSDIDAFHIMPDGSILFSITGTGSTPDGGTVDDSDIVKFVPTSIGSTTAGTFEMYFDGSDVGLTARGEDIDSIYVAGNGDIYVSTLGSVSVPGASGADEDVLVFTPTSLGNNTTGTWTIHMDNSDVGLNNSGDEDVWGVWLDEGSNETYLTTRGNYDVTGLTGDGADIFTCSGTYGSATNCTFSLYWSGSSNGVSGERIDGIHINP